MKWHDVKWAFIRWAEKNVPGFDYLHTLAYVGKSSIRKWERHDPFGRTLLERIVARVRQALVFVHVHGDWAYGLSITRLKVWRDFLSDHTGGDEVIDESYQLAVKQYWSWTLSIGYQHKVRKTHSCKDGEDGWTQYDQHDCPHRAPRYPWDACSCGDDCDGGEWDDFHTVVYLSLDRLFGYRGLIRKAKDTWAEIASVYFNNDPHICPACKEKARPYDGMRWTGLGSQTSLDSRGYHRAKVVEERNNHRTQLHDWTYRTLCGIDAVVTVDSSD